MTDAATDLAPPAFRIPGVRVRLDGAELDTERVALLSAVRVRREASAPAACALLFEDPADSAALDRVLSLGTSVEVHVEGATGPLFAGRIVALEHAYAVDGTLRTTARAQDSAHRLRADSQLRVFVDVSVAELARELTGSAGLAVEAPEGPRLPRLVQDGRSALDLLTMVTRRAGLWWQVDAAGAVLQVFDGSGSGAEARARIGRNVLEATVTTSALPSRSGWRLLGWDPATGAVVTGTADGASSRGEASQAVLGGAITGGAEQLDALATGLAGDDAAAEGVIHAVLEGDTSLAPGTALVVDGLPGDAPSRFVLLVTDHVFDAVRGYTTTVSSRPPEHLRLLRRLDTAPGREASALTVAEVLRIDDPEARGRVTVGLSAYDGLESEWLPVLALGAGEAKGLTVQPDIGDRVIVAHDARDPARGVVLGGLRTTDGGEPGAGVVGGAVGVYGLRLPTGQALRLSADGDALVLSNHAGSRIELTEGGIVVHAAGDLILEAPGRLLRLQADRIELERA